MSGYSIFNRQRFSKYLCCVGCALLMILATGCGDKPSNPETTEQVTTDSTATGSAVLSIQWHRASTDSYTTSAPVRQAIEDCAGVASITCQVYDENDNLIANGGPWLCVDKQGRIDRIPVGANRTFAVLGWDAQEGGNIVYQGRTASGIDISPRQIADAGTIDAYPFVPLLSNPADGQNVTVNAFSLTWDSVANAYAYRILVSEDSNFTSPVMDETTTETIYAPLNLSGSTTYYWMIRAIDIHGNESADSQVWSFITNDVDVCMAPVLDPIGNRQVDEGNTLTFTLSATDPDSGNLTYSHSSLPTGAEFNQDTRTFSWTPAYGNEGNYPVTFTVCDDCDDGPLCDSEEVTITVGNVCRPPVLSPIGNRRVDEGDTLRFTLSATDPDGVDLTYSHSTLPTGAEFNANSRTFSWSPDYGAAGNYSVTFTVCDDCPDEPLCDSEEVTITVGDVCQPPVLSRIGNRRVDEGDTLRFTLSATDPDGVDLTYSHSTLPTGAEFNQETNTFSWTPGYGAAGNYSVTFTVCDDCDDGPLCDSEEVTITVGDVCQPPVLSRIGNRRVDEGDTLRFTLSATDPDGGDLTYSHSTLPTGAEFNQETNTFSWTPGYGAAGNYSVTFTVCDDCPDEPLCDSEEVTITVGNVCRPPVLDTIGSRRIIEGNQLTFTANASDPDTGDELTFSASNLPTGAQFNQNTRTFTWTPNYHDAGTYTVRIQVCDNCAQLCDFEDVTITVAHGNPIVGEWEERVDIDCDGGAGINTLIFHADNTFESEPRCSEYTGTWSLEGDSISFYYTACDYSDYSGTIDETGTQMSGRMGNGEHCWSATKID